MREGWAPRFVVGDVSEKQKQIPCGNDRQKGNSRNKSDVLIERWFERARL
jgi:hypothetical protein